MCCWGKQREPVLPVGLMHSREVPADQTKERQATEAAKFLINIIKTCSFLPMDVPSASIHQRNELCKELLPLQDAHNSGLTVSTSILLLTATLMDSGLAVPVLSEAPALTCPFPNGWGTASCELVLPYMSHQDGDVQSHGWHWDWLPGPHPPPVQKKQQALIAGELWFPSSLSGKLGKHIYNAS